MLFKCKKEDPLFDDLKFLVSAVSKEESDEALYNRVLAEKNGDSVLLVATDSRSLHIVRLNLLEGITFETGNYELIKSDGKEIVLYRREFEEPFPDWKQVVFTGKKILANLEIAVKYSPLAIYKICQAGHLLNFGQLNSLISAASWNVYFAKNENTLRFECMNMQAFIMRLSISEGTL